MVNKKKWLTILIVALFLVAIVVFGIISHFNTPGFHCLGSYMCVDFESKCFYFDSASGEFVGQGTVVLRGSGRKSNLFEGTLSVVEYKNPEEFADDAYCRNETFFKQTDMAISAKEKYWRIVCTEQYEVQSWIQGEPQLIQIPCNYHYTAYLDPENTDFLILEIVGQDGTDLMAVCADREGDAREQLEIVLTKLN